MKKILFIVITILSGIFIFFVINNNPFAIRNSNTEFFVEEKNQGIITIINIDKDRAWPIKGTEFIITEVESEEIVEILVTDKNGVASSKSLDYGRIYKIDQFQITNAYAPIHETIAIEINQDNHEIVIENELYDYVKDVYRTENQRAIITKLYMPVEVLMQKPELPNGCEIVSLTAILNAYGYEVSKTKMSDEYLPKIPFFRKNDRLYGANPYKAFAGNPRDENGFFVYAPPIVEAANKYFNEVGSDKRAIDMSGSTREEIIEQLNMGTPIVIWATLDLSPPKISYHWYFEETDEKFMAPVNLHAYVLKGYDDNNVYVMDPLKGQLIHNIDTFFESYFALGSHAMVVVEG